MTSLHTVSSSSATKFKIEQKVSDAGKKGPYAVERSLNPNDVVIKRRFGEGSKPLFQREDIAINRSIADDGETSKVAQHRPLRYSSSESSSPERYRHRDIHNTGAQASRQSYPSTKRPSSSTHAPSTTGTKRNLSPQKVPYYIDEAREKDRLRRVYGTTSPRRRRSFSPRSRSRSPRPARTKPVTPYYTPRRRRSHSREKYSYSRASTHRRRSSSKDRRYHTSYSSRRHSRSRSRSPRKYGQSRDRKKSSERNGGQVVAPPAATQIITIPVPVADYPYAFPTWPTQAAWGRPIPHAAAAPPPRFAPYPLPATVMPPIRAPYGMPPPYNAPMYRPRYQNHNYTPRPPRGSGARSRN